MAKLRNLFRYTLLWNLTNPSPTFFGVAQKQLFLADNFYLTHLLVLSSSFRERTWMDTYCGSLAHYWAAERGNEQEAVPVSLVYYRVSERGHEQAAVPATLTHHRVFVRLYRSCTTFPYQIHFFLIYKKLWVRSPIKFTEKSVFWRFNVISRRMFCGTNRLNRTEPQCYVYRMLL